MMTIEGVLHQRGSEMDLYSPQYFKTVQQFIDFVGGNNFVYLYGQEVINRSPTVVTIDRDAIHRLVSAGELVFTSADRVILMDTANKEYDVVHTNVTPTPQMYTEYYTRDSNDVYTSVGSTLVQFKHGVTYYTRKPWNTDPAWRVKDPVIPPEHGYIDTTTKVSMWELRSRYLAERDGTAPKYVSIDTDTANFVIRPNTVDNDLILAQRNFDYGVSDMLFFCNGLCCYPKNGVDDTFTQSVIIRDGNLYLNNQKDRHRGVVGVDFSKQCEVSFSPMAGGMLGGTLSELIIDSKTDVLKSSFLLVIDGRLYLPDEFVVFTDHTLRPLVAIEHPEYTLDRKCCENDFVGKVGDIAMTRTLQGKTTALKECRNSFLVTFARRGLKVIRHRCITPAASGRTLSPELSEGNYTKLLFNATARGLLFETSTRSVIDYITDYNDMTFYNNTGHTPVRWGTRTATIVPDTRLEIMAGYNNDMSANAIMHDRHTRQGSGFVLEPNYVMIEFLFESNN